ncbi:MAG: type VI secretion system protein TssA [Pseudomonadota bacterium]
MTIISQEIYHDSGIKIDFERLLQPISEDQPAGVDLRLDAATVETYYHLKDQRQVLRQQERKPAVDSEDHHNYGQWLPIAEQCLQLLQNTSKDLELASWLVESLTRLYGFAGLRDGLIVLQQLIATYGDILYPSMDEEGIHTTLMPIRILNGERSAGTLIAPIHLISLLTTTEGKAISTWDYQRLVDKGSARKNAGEFSLEELEVAVQQFGESQFIAQKNDLMSAMEALAQLDEMLSEQYGDAAPSFSAIHAALSAGEEVLNDFIKRFEKHEIVASDTQDKSIEPSNQHLEANVLIHDYDMAIDQLKKVLDFFNKTQPHSILTFSLARLVRWSGLALDKVIDEVIAEPQLRMEFSRATGVPYHNKDMENGDRDYSSENEHHDYNNYDMANQFD